MTNEKRSEIIAKAIVITGGKLSRAGDSVTVGYGPLGFLSLVPSCITRGEAQFDAVEIRGRLSARDGGNQKALREKLRAGGLEIA